MLGIICLKGIFQVSNHCESVSRKMMKKIHFQKIYMSIHYIKIRSGFCEGDVKPPQERQTGRYVTEGRAAKLENI